MRNKDFIKRGTALLKQFPAVYRSIYGVSFMTFY